MSTKSNSADRHVSKSLTRQWLVLRALCGSRLGLTVKELEAQHEIHEKTIRRDLIFLREIGFPLQETTYAHGLKRWQCQPTALEGQLSFDLSEVLSLYLSRRLLEPLAGTMFWTSLRSAFKKIRASLTEEGIAYLEQLQQVLHVLPGRTTDYEGREQMIDDLMVAIEDQRFALILYHSLSATEPVEYEVAPYGMVYDRGTLYLIAKSSSHEEVRTFKIDRIRDVEFSQLKFQKPKEFCLVNYHAQSFGIFREEGPAEHVVLKFHPDAARHLQEHRYHTTQHVHLERDGWAKVTFELIVSPEFRSWLLSFGPRVIVVAPKGLREGIQKDLEAALRAYIPAIVEPSRMRK
ncbi:helix-turn-helix transcriptional regulator [Lacunimicrobium album]